VSELISSAARRKGLLKRLILQPRRGEAPARVLAPPVCER